MNDRRPRYQSFFQWGLGAATGGLLIGLLAHQTIQQTNQRHLLTELADSHMRSLAGNHLVDTDSTNPPVVQQWFKSKVPFAPPVPDLSTAGYAFLGGRMDYVTGQGAAALVYTFDKHEVSVFIAPASGEIQQAIAPERGYRIASWSTANLSFYAVSDIAEHDLRDFVSAFQAKSNP